MQVMKLPVERHPSGEVIRLMSEEDCWEFFSENMAPFTSPRRADQSVSRSILVEEDCIDTLEKFFSTLSDVLEKLEKHEVKIDV